jgi:uncharacterized protein
MNTARILCSEAASALIQLLQKNHGELLFHQSGGCCDGSQPMCFTIDDFRIGGSDVCLGTIENCTFWMSKDQFEYWKHTQLTLDVVEGRGASFSLEIPYGQRFIIHSRLYSEIEAQNLEPLKYWED